MWILLTLWGSAEAVDCPLARARPAEEWAIHTTLRMDTEPRDLPRGSLLRHRPEIDCAEGTGVEVLSQVYFYQRPGVPLAMPGDRGCVPETDLGGTDSVQFMVLPPPPGARPALSPGQLLGPVEDSEDCAAVALLFGEESIAVEQLDWVRALSPELLRRTIELEERWLLRHGSVMRGRVWLSDWGYLSLPMLRYRDSAELEAEWEREALGSPEQRERAVSALGPESLWLHFLGSDARFSDAWGRPETVDSLAALAQDWIWWCTGEELADRGRCTLQIGDIAWYNPRLPDPLGHSEHFDGRCVDLRLFRQDGSHYEAWWNRPDDRPGREQGYDQVLTQAFVDFARSRPSVELLYFNDPEVRGVQASAGHDDHIHLCFSAMIEPEDE